MIQVLVPYRAVSCGLLHRAAHGLGGKAAAAHNRRRSSGHATAGPARGKSPAPRRICHAVPWRSAHMGMWAIARLQRCAAAFVSRSGVFVCLYPGQGSCLFVCIQVGGVCLFVSRSGKLSVDELVAYLSAQARARAVPRLHAEAVRGFVPGGRDLMPTLAWLRDRLRAAAQERDRLRDRPPARA